MQMAVIIDLFLAAVLVLCTVLGFRRGAFKSVIGIVIVVAALIGAGLVSAQGAPVAAKALAPVLSEQIEARFDKAVQELLPSGTEAGEEEAAGIFSAAGFYRRTADDLARNAVGQVKESGKTMVEAAVESTVRSVAAAVLFVVGFIVLLIVLKLVSNVLGLLTAVPGLHLMNALGGGALGLLQGHLILCAVIWAAQFFGNGISEQVVEQTVLFRFFVALNPIEWVSGV